MAVARPRLGELLLAQNVCDRESLREAWETKVIYGDRLGTNLLALGLINEESLALALGEQHGVHAAYRELIQVDPRAIALVPRSLAEKWNVVPHHVKDRTLWLLMTTPHDAQAIDEVRFRTGLRVRPVVVVEARMWVLLSNHYGASPGMRPVSLDGGPQRRRAEKQRVAEKAAAAQGEELTSEADFERLYAGMHNAPMLVEPPHTPPPIAPTHAPQSPHAPHYEAAVIGGPPPVDGGSGPSLEEAMRLVSGEQSPMNPTDTMSDAFWPPLTSSLEAEKSWREQITDRHDAPVPIAAEPSDDDDGGDKTNPEMDLAPPMTLPESAIVHSVEMREDPPLDIPLSFDEATKLLDQATDRAAIARIVLRYAHTVFPRAGLLTVHPTHIVGWQGIGTGLDTETLKQIVLERKDKSVFSLVADTRAQYIGPLTKLPAHGAWVKATGRQIPKSVAVLPVLVRGQCINLFYGDNGHDQFVSSDVGTLLILMKRITDSYEHLLEAPL